MEETSILSILPRSGPRSGGTKVVLYGSNFVQSGSLICQFGDVYSKGEYVSNSTMYCISPWKCQKKESQKELIQIL